MVINHFIISLVIFFLSCWRPPEDDLEYFTALCRNFFWGGDPYIRKIAKVKWDFWCAPKTKGGLGIIDIKETIDKLVANWILRGMINPNLHWAWLINRKNHLFHIQGFHKWTALPFYTTFASKFGISAKGTELAVSLWKAWFRIKRRLKISSHAKDLAGFHRIDSIWWPTLELPRVQHQDLEDVLKMHKMGIKKWKNLWDDDTNTWMSRANLIASFNLSD